MAVVTAQVPEVIHQNLLVSDMLCDCEIAGYKGVQVSDIAARKKTL